MMLMCERADCSGDGSGMLREKEWSQVERWQCLLHADDPDAIPAYLLEAPGPALSPKFNQDMSLSMGFLPASASSISFGRLA